MGYSYVYDDEDGETLRSHSYPDMLVRIGMFTEWFELRIGQTFSNERTRNVLGEQRANGAQDLLLGFRFDLTEQKHYLPEMSLVYQMTLPTGDDDFSTDEVMPGVALWYSWELSDTFSLAGGSQANRSRDDTGDFYVEYAQSLSLAYSLGDRLGGYAEWFTLIPQGATEPGLQTEHYFDTGFTYLLADNLQIDVFAGMGLNANSDDFFGGTGLVYRY